MILFNKADMKKYIYFVLILFLIPSSIALFDDETYIIKRSCTCTDSRNSLNFTAPYLYNISNNVYFNYTLLSNNSGDGTGGWTNTSANTTTNLKTIITDSLTVGNNTSPSYTLEVMGTGIMRIRNSETNLAVKTGYILGGHYNNSKAPISAFLLQGSNGNNNVYYCGGSGSFNACTNIYFYTAPNDNTKTGTLRMHINSAGNIGIGQIAVSTSKLIVNGSFRASNISVQATDNYSQLMCLNVSQTGTVTAYKC